jgi:hypothetical protein
MTVISPDELDVPTKPCDATPKASIAPKSPIKEKSMLKKEVKTALIALAVCIIWSISMTLGITLYVRYQTSNQRKSIEELTDKVRTGELLFNSLLATSNEKFSKIESDIVDVYNSLNYIAKIVSTRSGMTEDEVREIMRASVLSSDLSVILEQRDDSIRREFNKVQSTIDKHEAKLQRVSPWEECDDAAPRFIYDPTRHVFDLVKFAGESFLRFIRIFQVITDELGFTK